MSVTAQRALAEFVATYPDRGIADSARHVARVSLLDCLAVAFAGRTEPVNAMVARYAAGSRDSAGVRTWLTGMRYQAEPAALLNAVAAHALDYDDVTPAWRGHPGAVLWPAICAGVKVPAASLESLANAFVIGFEVGAQVGARFAAHHYPAGWHATATIGVIAATAACCRAQELDASQCFNAIGLAAAQSAGLQSNFGSMAKPLQAGFAASAAVRATELARVGVQAADVLEGPNGFASLYAGQSELPVDLPSVGEKFAIVTTGIEVKQFPNCYASHRAVEAALAIRSELRGNVNDVLSIQIEGTPTAHKALLDRLPRNVDEARFSAEYGVACALADGAVRFSHFDERQLRRGDLAKLMSVAGTGETVALGPRRAARVTLEMKNGARVRHTVTDLPGLFDEAGFMNRLKAKVADCLAHAALEEHASALCEAALDPAAGTPESFAVLDRIWRQEKEQS